MDASTDPTPDLGNASGGNDVTTEYWARATAHLFAQEAYDACIFVGGEAPHPYVAPVVQRCRISVAADSGWRHARLLDVTPDSVVGDFDSITADELHEAQQSGGHIVEYPSDKDMTDAEIGLQYAVDAGCTSLVLVSGGGDRFDHIFSMLHALADIALTGVRTSCIINDTRIDIATPVVPFSSQSEYGQIVSLLPIAGDVLGAATVGLRWALTNETLFAKKSRGVSNIVTEQLFTISITHGTLAVVRPQYFPVLPEKK